MSVIADSAKDAIVMVDHEGRISYWNPAAEKTFGYTSQEAGGEDLVIIVPDRYHEAFWKGFRELRDKGPSSLIDKPVVSEAIRKDRTEFPVEFSISTVQTESEWHALGIVRDITDRRRMEEGIRAILDKYHLMLNNQRDVIMMVDIDSQRILEVNDAVVPLYGFSKDELREMTIPDISATHERLDFQNKKFVDQSTSHDHVFSHRKKDGTTFPVQISACGFIWKNRKTFCAIVKDRTGTSSVK